MPLSAVKIRSPLPALLLCATLSACSWNFPYTIPVQQGNVITVQMLQELELGMDKRKVRFVLGTPLVTDAFHQDRWDYFYSYAQGSQDRVQQRASLYFEGDKLVRVDANIDSKLDFHTVTDASENVLIMPKKKKGGFLAAITPAFIEREGAEAREVALTRSLDSGYNRRQPGSGTAPADEPVDEVPEPAAEAAAVIGPSLGATGTPSELYAPNTSAEFDVTSIGSTEPAAPVEVVSPETRSRSLYLEGLFAGFGAATAKEEAEAEAKAEASPAAAPPANVESGFAPQPTRD